MLCSPVKSDARNDSAELKNAEDQGAQWTEAAGKGSKIPERYLSQSEQPEGEAKGTGSSFLNFFAPQPRRDDPNAINSNVATKSSHPWDHHNAFAANLHEKEFPLTLCSPFSSASDFWTYFIAERHLQNFYFSDY